MDYIEQVRQALRSKWWRWRLSKQSLRVLLGGYDARGEYGDTIAELRRCVDEASDLLGAPVTVVASIIRWRDKYRGELEDARDSRDDPCT